MAQFDIADLSDGTDLRELSPRRLHERGLAWLEAAQASADSPASQARVAQAFFIAAVSAQALADDEETRCPPPVPGGRPDSHGMVPRDGR